MHIGYTIMSRASSFAADF